MTVEDLIEELQRMPKHTRVVLGVREPEFGKDIVTDYEAEVVFDGDRVTVRPGKRFHH